MSGSSFVFGFAGRLVALALTVGVVAASAPTLGWAQGTSVEELERRLEKAKEERARRDAAAARARDGAEAERKRREADASRAESERKAQESRAESERKAQESRLSTLVVQADAPCTLFVNGKETQRLRVGVTEVKVSPGESLVRCVSSDEDAAFDGKVDARSGQNSVLQIELAARVERIRSAKSSAARQESERRAACARGDHSFMEPTNDREVLRQFCTNTLWTRSSTDYSFGSWHSADGFCRGRGQGWTLPTAEQLQALVNSSLPGTDCNLKSQYGNCKVSSEFRLNGWKLWGSNFSATYETSFSVNMQSGTRESIKASNDYGGGALCVKRQ